jgi:pilus assembly protein CpaC
MPGAGDLPILGSLFRSTNFRKGETELVIIVTPYLVKPVDANDIKLPTDGFNAPNELQRLLGNQTSDGVTGGDRPKPSAAGETAANPTVGVLDNTAPAAGKSDNGKPAQSRSSRRSQAALAAVAAPSAAPGFTLD